MFWKKQKKQIDQLSADLFEAQCAIEELSAKLKALDPKRVDALEQRVISLEGSDFNRNREDYAKHMRDLKRSNPGVHLYPM